MNKRTLGRWELLGWINDFLCFDVSKVEDLGDGIAYCQILDAVYPGKVLLHKLNFGAKSPEEKLRNLRVCPLPPSTRTCLLPITAEVLEKAMRDCEIEHVVHSDAIARGSFPENLAFLQFLHQFVQRTCPGAHLQYNPLGRRREAISMSPTKQPSTDRASKSKGGFVGGGAELVSELGFMTKTKGEEVLFQLRALQETLEEDLTLRLTRQAAAKQQLLWQRDERDFLAQKLERIEPICKQHMGCYSSAQVSAIILAPLPCMQ